MNQPTKSWRVGLSINRPDAAVSVVYDYIAAKTRGGAIAVAEDQATRDFNLEDWDVEYTEVI